MVKLSFKPNCHSDRNEVKRNEAEESQRIEQHLVRDTSTPLHFAQYDTVVIPTRLSFQSKCHSDRNEVKRNEAEGSQNIA